MTSEQAQVRSDAILAEFKETRGLAINGAVDAVSLRAVNLRIDLEQALARIAELEAQLKSDKSDGDR